MSRTHLYLAAIVAVSGCASGTGGSGATHSSSALSTEEIAAVNVEGRTAFDVVTRLRPKWLVARGVKSLIGNDSAEYPMVIVDGRAEGRTGALRDIPADEIATIHYYDIAEAPGKFGHRGASGVIEVKLKRASHQ